MTGDVKRITRECREWLALLQSSDASEADRARFAAWLQADPRHRRAYHGLHMLWRDIATLDQLQALQPGAPRAISSSAEKTTRRLLLVAVAALVGFALALLLTQSR